MNIPFIFAKIIFLKPDKSKENNKRTYKLISLTLLILQLDKSNDFKEEQSENIFFVLIIMYEILIYILHFFQNHM